MQFAYPNELWGQDQQHCSKGKGETFTKPSCYLASLALDEEINPLVLVTQLAIQFILESMEGFCLIIAARYSFCLTLSLGGAGLD